jgi:hypothetical protein
MKIRELIEKLLIDNDLEDEVIVDWFDKGMFTDMYEMNKNTITREEFDKAWLTIQQEGQNQLSHFLSHYDLCNDIGNLINEEIEEKRKDV